LLFVVGPLFGLVGSSVSLIQRFRHTVRASATAAEALVLKVILAGIALLVVLSLVLTATARTTVAAEIKGGALSVEQKNTLFSPDLIHVKAGQTIRIVVKNDDTTLHTFTLDQAGVNVSIPPGAERLIEFQAPASGVYQWYCIPHSDPSANGRTGMVGSLVVQ
jgi:plastocyanin